MAAIFLRPQCVNTVEQSLCRLDVRFGVRSGKVFICVWCLMFIWLAQKNTSAQWRLAVQQHNNKRKFASRHMSVTPVCPSVEVNATSKIRLEQFAFILFTLVSYFYRFIVSVTSHNWMLHLNAASQLYTLYKFYCLVCLFVLYVQCWRTLQFGAI